MENDQITESVVAVTVIDNSDLSFFYLCDSRTTADVYIDPPDCTVKVSQETFERLLAGISTFEQEVNNGHVVISGDSQTLRTLGKIFRSA